MPGRELPDRVAQLERRLGRDSPASSRPPSADGPYVKERAGRDQSLRGKSFRRPGKRLSTDGSAMKLVECPDKTVECQPTECSQCGMDLSGQPAIKERRRL